MEGFEDFAKMEELMQKYLSEGYRLGSNSEMVYQDPENSIIAKEASRASRKPMIISIIVLIAMAATFAAMIVTGSDIKWTIFMGVVVVAIAIFVFKDIPGKSPKVMKATAIFKNKRFSGSLQDSARRTYTYFVTVIPESGEKIIFRDLQVSREDYEQIQEGTPILVVKGGFACIR